MKNDEYIGLNGRWSSLYRYIQHFGVQLAAGASNMVLVMPIFSPATWPNLGIFRHGWKEMMNAILVEVQKVAWPDNLGETMDRNKNAMTDVILSDFSAGRLAMGMARSVHGMGDYLREVWDFDGASAPSPHGPRGGQALIYDQAVSGAGHNIFHVPTPRWRNFPFYFAEMKFDDLHGQIPMRLFYHASTMSAYGS